MAAGSNRNRKGGINDRAHLLLRGVKVPQVPIGSGKRDRRRQVGPDPLGAHNTGESNKEILRYGGGAGPSRRPQVRPERHEPNIGLAPAAFNVLTSASALTLELRIRTGTGA